MSICVCLPTKTGKMTGNGQSTEPSSYEIALKKISIKKQIDLSFVGSLQTLNHLLYLFLQLSRLLLQNGGLGSDLCTTLSLLLQVLNLSVGTNKTRASAGVHRFIFIIRSLTSADTPWWAVWLCCICAPEPDTGPESPSGARPPPGTDSEPPSSSPPVSPSAPCSPAASAPAGLCPSASAASPAPRGAAGDTEQTN